MRKERRRYRWQKGGTDGKGREGEKEGLMEGEKELMEGGGVALRDGGGRDERKQEDERVAERGEEW